MTINIAINGYGRIGRQILRAIYENDRQNQIKVVAINDLTPIETSAHLTRYDSVHGKFPGSVEVDGNFLIINGDKIAYTAISDPKQISWKQYRVDVVHECTGLFTKRDKAQFHLAAGTKKILISAPASDVDKTIVYGVNHQTLSDSDIIVSNASCTTNCLAPLIKPLLDEIGVIKGFMTTIHAYTNDQVLIDKPHKDLRRARAAALSMIPTKTGAATAVGLVIPALKDRLDGYAIRVPTANVSIVDLTFEAKRNTTIDEVNQILKKASESSLKGILAYTDEPLVSCDFNHHPASTVYDANLTKVYDNLVKVSAWYDNEWAFSIRMLDTTLAMMGNRK